MPEKSLCPCAGCGGRKLVTQRTLLRHMEARGSTNTAAVVIAMDRVQKSFCVPLKRKNSEDRSPDSARDARASASPPPHTTAVDDDGSGITDGLNIITADPDSNGDRPEPLADPDRITNTPENQFGQVRPNLRYINSDLSEPDDEVDEDDAEADASDLDEYGLDLFGEDDDTDPPFEVGEDSARYDGLRPGDVVNERWRLEAMKRRMHSSNPLVIFVTCLTSESGHQGLPEDHQEIMRAYSLHITNNLTHNTWDSLSKVFRHVNLPSLPSTTSLVRGYSGVDPIPIDCCTNSCCAFTGARRTAERCDMCNEPRYGPSATGNSRPVKQFYYMPIRRRLICLYESKKIAKAMRYRAVEHEEHREEGEMMDIFDGAHYRHLRSQDISITGLVGFRHKYFDGERDIALGLSTDGFAPFRRRRQSAWPLLLFNYNLPPEIHFHQEHIIPLGVIPGPRAVRDINSFLQPLVDELVEFAAGVPALDAVTEEIFCLRAISLSHLGTCQPSLN